MINGNYAISSGIKPAKEALVLESAKNSPYGNFLAVKEGDEKDPRVKKLAKLLTSPEVKKFIEDKYLGLGHPVLLSREGGLKRCACPSSPWRSWPSV